MNLQEIRDHWQSWASQYGTDLRATTKTSTLKTIELDVLRRTLHAISCENKDQLRILEVGCGNGQNCLALSEIFPEASFTGIDFIGEMVSAANQLKSERNIPDERVIFREGNVLDLDIPPGSFDVVFSDRCLINLNTDRLQQEAISALSDLIAAGGYLLMVENSWQTYEAQNQARELVGLSRRTPAEFNHFFDETTLLPFLPLVGLEVLEVEDFISLHDLVLYVLVPMTNGGKIDYEHPLVTAATDLSIALSSVQKSSVGAFGQNRLYKCRKLAKL